MNLKEAEKIFLEYCNQKENSEFYTGKMLDDFITLQNRAKVAWKFICENK